MRILTSFNCIFSKLKPICKLVFYVGILLIPLVLISDPALAQLKVMRMGVGSGTITSSPPGINCGSDCDENYGSAVSVTLTATPDAGSSFSGWEGDCSGSSTTCTVTVGTARSVRAVFDLAPAIPSLSRSPAPSGGLRAFTPAEIQTFLNNNPEVNSPARFIKALPDDFKQNWILMSRSESLQSGTAKTPRILLPSEDAKSVFTVGMTQHSSYPGAHPNAIEYMQWDGSKDNFRFHEIVLDNIPAMGSISARSRGVTIDDLKCSKCHSTQNVLSPGTAGTTPGSIKAKNKPNWDAYDSWAGMLPFNRDRIYQGSVEAAAFRKILNPWTWRTEADVRAIIEQLELQPPPTPSGDDINRTSGGANDGHVNFAFDASPPVLTEPAPTGSEPSISTSYSFDRVAGTGSPTSVKRGGSFVTLHHSSDPGSDEGRGVNLFDRLGGLDGGFDNKNLNSQRIADELINHRFATGSVPIDIRPIALAITRRLVEIDQSSTPVTVKSTISEPLVINLAFFDSRNGMTINDLLADTRDRAESLPRRKADIQRTNLDRNFPSGVDPYLDGTGSTNGLIQEYGSATSGGTSIAMNRLRQEVFRRDRGIFPADNTVMNGIYVDREQYSFHTKKIALYRYFLEPLGVSVDKWSMGVRARSRTYTFADVFSTYDDVLEPELEASLRNDPVPGLTDPTDDTQLIKAVNRTLSSLPPATDVPTYTDVQRIFNKSCIECHGGLDYPPYSNYNSGTVLNLSENENPPSGEDRLDRSHRILTSNGFVTTNPATSTIYQRITMSNEDCPYGLMPCGGPPLSKTDVETIRRWIVGDTANTRGDPHIKTVDGVNYDFQADGEFVLLRGQNLEIQTRQVAVETQTPLGPNPHTGLTSCVSVNNAVALRVGDHRITYQPDLSGEPNPEGLQLRIDGELMKMSSEDISLPSGGRIVQTTAPGGIKIKTPGGTAVVVTPNWWNQTWHMNITVENARATTGLMGTIAPDNWLPAMPDGSLLGSRPDSLQQRYRELYETFGDAWRVNDTTTLFDYAPGTSTETFTLESWPIGESPQSCTLPPEAGRQSTAPPAEPLPEEIAEQHCSDIIADDARANCVQDVMVTGAPEFAQTYLREQEVEQNTKPIPPALVFPEAFEVDLSTPVDFTWKKTSDEEGDAMSYRHCVWEVSEGYHFINACEMVTQAGFWSGGTLYATLIILLGCILIALLIFIGKRKRSRLLVLLGILILAAAFLAYYFGDRGNITRKIANLDSGKAYYWKVIAEDGKGNIVESETRRFEIK